MSMGIMGIGAQFINAAGRGGKKAGNQLSFIGSTADPSIYQLSCSGEIQVASIKNGEQITATYTDLSNTQVSIQADANTDVVIKGDVTKIAFTSDWGTGYSNVASIDLSKCNTLKELGTKYNTGLTALDLSANTALENLDCENCTGLTTIYLLNSNALVNLNCKNTGLTALDLSANTALKNLDCTNCGGLTALDLSANTALENLTCDSCTGLTTINLPHSNSLVNFSCYFCGEITALDLSANTALELLNCNTCAKLSTLNLSTNTTLESIELASCPKLVSIFYPATNSDVSEAIANAISDADSASGTVYTDSAAAYYSTIATAATTKGWTIAPLA